MLKSVRESNKSIKIRILTPHDDSIKQIAKKMNDELKIETRNILDYLHTMVTILIIDRRYTLTIELKDDAKTSSYDAIGLEQPILRISLSVFHTYQYSKVYGSKQSFMVR